MSTAVPSPCVNICQMDTASGWCGGCLRTLQEIGAWSRLSDEAKRAVWAQLPDRRVSWQRSHPRPAPAAEGEP